MRTTSVGRYALRLSFGQVHLINGNMESSVLQAGDLCLDCQQLGLEKHLRYFTINLQEEQILKCENTTCLYPHNDEISSSTDDDDNNDNDNDNVKNDYENFTKTHTSIFRELQDIKSPKEILSKEDFSSFLTAAQQETTLDFSLDFLEDLKKDDLKTSTITVQQNTLNSNLPSISKQDFVKPKNDLNLNLPSIGKKDRVKSGGSRIIKEEIEEKPKIQIQSVETVKTRGIFNLDRPSLEIPKADIRSRSMKETDKLLEKPKFKNNKTQIKSRKPKANALDQVMSLLKLKKNS